MRHYATKFLTLLLTTLAFALPAAAQDPLADEPLPELCGPFSATEFTGNWLTNRGPLTLLERDGKVTGGYTQAPTGRIEGTVKNGVLYFRWRQKDGTWGRGVFRLLKGRKLEGKWGSGEDATSGGKWGGPPIN